MAYSFRDICDINYCKIFYSIPEHKAKEIVKTWCKLNEESYCIKYKYIPYNLAEYLSFNKTEQINTFQMLKYLKCIRYNIEEEEIKQIRNLTPTEETYIKLLNTAIKEIQGRIINDIPEYQNAKWCE